MGDPLIFAPPTSKINFSDKFSENSECQPFLKLTMAEKIGKTKCYLDQIRFEKKILFYGEASFLKTKFLTSLKECIGLRQLCVVNFLVFLFLL